MKNLAIFCLAIISSAAFGQRLSVGAFFSGNTGLNKDNFTEYSFYDYAYDGTSQTRTQEMFSLGQGVSYGLNGTLMFNQHLGVGLDLAALKSSSIDVQDQYTNSDIYYYLRSSAVRIAPNVVVSTADSGAVILYAKFGMVFQSTNIEYAIDEVISDSSVGQRYEFDTPMSIGLTSALGIEVRLTDNFSVFGELNNVNVSVTPDKAELVYFNNNGVDELSLQIENDVTTNYVDSYIDNGTFDPDVADTQLKFNLPFNSVGLKIGAKLSF